MTKELTDRSALEPLVGSGWSMVEGRDALTKEFKFKSFRSRLGLDEPCGALGRESWTTIQNGPTPITVLQVLLTTHACDGLSDLDVKLAQEHGDGCFFLIVLQSLEVRAINNVPS